MENRDLEIFFQNWQETRTRSFLFIYTDLTKWNGSSQAHSFVPIYRPQKRKKPESLVNFEKSKFQHFNIIDLIILSKLETSKSEIKRLIKGNAIKINDEKISDEKLVIKKELFNKGYIKLSVGKKRHMRIDIN